MGFCSTVGNSSVFACHVAKFKILTKLSKTGTEKKYDLLKKLVGYYGDVSHSHTLKAFVLNGITNSRQIPSKFNSQTQNFEMDYVYLKKQILKDVENGLIPFFLFGVIGATPTGGNDNLNHLGDIAKEFDMFFMVDAAYAGCFFICKEFRQYKSGLQKANGYVINPAKTMLTGMDTSILCIDDQDLVYNALEIDPKSRKIGSSITQLGEISKQGNE